MDKLRVIQAAIKSRGALWTAGESWITHLSIDERRKLLGGKPEKPGMSKEVTVSTAFSVEKQALLPNAIDWRNKDGHNWITPVKDQALCGSCVAFASIATLESLVRITHNQPDLDIDLSEMHLFNCGGGDCNGGWYNSSACSYLKENGAPDEDCWPYRHFDEPCPNTCPDWQSRVVKITDYGHISGIDACRSQVQTAPIMVGMEVYADFYHYKSGIYEHTWGDKEGYHSVSIVGYDMTADVPYWIAKNSWGGSWGENGFFRIKMGECDIETLSTYWMSKASPYKSWAVSYYGYVSMDYEPNLSHIDADTLITVTNSHPSTQMGVYMELFGKDGTRIWQGPLLDNETPKQILSGNEYVWITLGYVLELLERDSQTPYGSLGGEILPFQIWTTPKSIPPVVGVKQVVYHDTQGWDPDNPDQGPERLIWDSSLFTLSSETTLGGINGTGIVKCP